MDTGLAQIIVAIIGILGPIIVELLKKPEPASATVIQPSSTSIQAQPLQAGRKSRNLLDLSIFLLYGALFSALLADSLLVSGRIPELSLLVLVQIFLIALFTTLTLVLAWYWRKGESIVGILSTTTLVVLLLSPGGVLFNPVQEQGEKEAEPR